jgi:copper chaperone CopZ
MPLIRDFSRLSTRLAWCLCLTSATLATSLRADDPATEPKVMKHQVTGLFCPEREQDFKELCAEKLAKYKLVSIDYANAEATFAYDPAKEFPGAKPEQVIERFDNEVRNVSRSTFGIRPMRMKSREELQLAEFLIAGLDCKACSLAVYEILLRQKGVEQATASFKTGKATALFDPQVIDRATLEKSLRERGVTLKPAE